MNLSTVSYRPDSRREREAMMRGALIAASRRHIRKAMLEAGRVGDDRERLRLARLLDADMRAD